MVGAMTGVLMCASIHACKSTLAITTRVPTR
jgi:hypothetical protein